MQLRYITRHLSFQQFIWFWLVVFGIMTIVLYYLYERRHRPSSSLHNNFIRSRISEYQSKEKIAVAIVIPYIDQPLPIWFDSFVASIEFTASDGDNVDPVTIHWLIFHNQPDFSYENTSHVKLMHLSDNDLSNRFSSLRQILNHVLSNTQWSLALPYRMVEYKPAFGYLFRDYLHSYHYWGYGDLDILASYSYLQHVLSQEYTSVMAPRRRTSLLEAFDVITFTYGDHVSLYLRGQLTLFRNNYYSRYLMWNKCIQTLLDGQSKGMKGFQSAEGCITKEIVTSNVSIAYIPIQFSDALMLRGAWQEKYRQYELPERESLYFRGNLLKCYFKGTDDHGHGQNNAIESYLLQPQPLQPLSPSHTHNAREVYFREPRCSYWIHPQHDVCTSNVPSNAIIARESFNQRFYFRKAYNRIIEMCNQGAFTHFQGWKRNYYHFTTRPSLLIGSSDSMIMTVVSQYGFIPWIYNSTSLVPFTTANHLKPRYCIQFRDDLKACNLWLSKQAIEVVDLPSNSESIGQGNSLNPNDATLVIVLSENMHETNNFFQLLSDEIHLSLNLKYLILVFGSTNNQLRNRVVHELVETMMLSRHLLIRCVFVEVPPHISLYSIEKTLYNIAVDHIYVVPSYPELIFLQPSSLKFSHLPWNEMLTAWKVLPNKESSSLAFGSSEDIQVPVLFNVNNAYHGRNAARFPEELNGNNCLNNVLILVLRGLGYDMHFFHPNSLEIRSYETVNSFHDMFLEADTNNCFQGIDQRHAFERFFISLDKYFDRMQEIRNSKVGICSISSTREFAFGANSNSFYEVEDTKWKL